MLEGLLLKQGNVVSLNVYRDRVKPKTKNTPTPKTKQTPKKEDMATTYDKGIYTIKEIKEGGKVVLDRAGKEYKILLEWPHYKHLAAGMRLKALLKRKMFYTYWEVEYIQELISKTE